MHPPVTIEFTYYADEAGDSIPTYAFRRNVVPKSKPAPMPMKKGMHKMDGGHMMKDSDMKKMMSDKKKKKH